MLGQWRLTLRQAEEAIRSERLEEALELANRPEVAEHRKALQLRDQIAIRLAERARDQMRYGQSQAAWQDLRRAELAGAPPGKLAQVRGELTERGVAELRSYLDAGNPGQAVTLAETLKLRGADTVELRALREAALSWQRAECAVSVGEFAQALECIETARRQLGGHPALEQKLKGITAARERASTLQSELQAALAGQDWAGVLQAGDALLQMAPDCRAVRHARDEALRRFGVPMSMRSARGTAPLETAAHRATCETPCGPRTRFILWVDGVGGYLVCEGSVVTVGQATPGNTVDIPILGDLSRQHATFVRDGEGYLVRSERELSVNGRATHQSPLEHGNLVRLGNSVQLRFSLPCPVSGTARLDLTSRHRLQLSLAGILLMADTCVLGPSAQANVRVAQADRQVVLYRQADSLWCRAEGTMEIDGQTYQSRGPLRLPARASIGELSFSVEPLSSPLTQV